MHAVKPEPPYDPMKPDTTWRKGTSCHGAHPCPNKKFPNHHDATCQHPHLERDVQTCNLCHTLVCGRCKLTIF